MSDGNGTEKRVSWDRFIKSGDFWKVLSKGPIVFHTERVLVGANTVPIEGDHSQEAQY